MSTLAVNSPSRILWIEDSREGDKVLWRIAPALADEAVPHGVVVEQADLPWLVNGLSAKLVLIDAAFEPLSCAQASLDVSMLLPSPWRCSVDWLVIAC